MRRTIVGAIAAAALLVTAVPASAAPPTGAGGGGKPAGVACQQFGIGVLQSQGLLSSVARNGLPYPIENGTTYSLAQVLDIHRTNTPLANEVLTEYAIALDIATPEVVAALNAACPTL